MPARGRVRVALAWSTDPAPHAARSDIGGAMGETLKQHDVLIDAIDEKMDSVTKDLTTNNMKLKGMVTKVRGSVW